MKRLSIFIVIIMAGALAYATPPDEAHLRHAISEEVLNRASALNDTDGLVADVPYEAADHPRAYDERLNGAESTESDAAIPVVARGRGLWDASRGDNGTACHTPYHLEWGPCPEGYISECTTLLVPLDWRHVHGATIEVFVSRYPARGEESQGQLWLLDGGPGSSGESFGAALDTVFAPFRDYDIYVLEHRGVGESTRLSCPDQESADSPGGFEILPEELPDCLAYLDVTWGDGLGQLNITNAARDLAYAIAITRRGREPVFVYGYSYGTLWAQRLLQVAPEIATGVILDSVLPPVEASVFGYDAQTDPVAQDLSRLCAHDDVCGDKLGRDPWQAVLDTKALLDTGHCPELGLSGATFTRVGATMMFNRVLRNHFFPLIYRIERCDDADVAVVQHYLGVFATLLAPSPELGRFSTLLQYNIPFVEIITEPVPSFEEVASYCFTEAGLCPGFSFWTRQFYDPWPLYEPDHYFRRWFTSRTPILALNGDLDPQTPYTLADAIVPHLRGPGQSYIQVPYSPHGVAINSQVQTEGSPTCGIQLMQQFIADPRHPPTTECLDDVVPVTFTAVPGEAMFFFGQTDVWENPAAAARPLDHALAVDMRDLDRRLRSATAIERDRRIQAAMRQNL